MGKTVVNENGVQERVARTQSGKELQAGVVVRGTSHTPAVAQEILMSRIKLLCTGQTPNTALLREALPDAIVPEGPSKNMVRVSRTMQVAVPRRTREASADTSVEQVQDKLAQVSIAETPVPTEAESPERVDVPHPHLFAIGDAADAFGAIKAGHTAHFQVCCAR